MHRFTPASGAMRAFTSGGARTLIKSVEDGQLMQAMSGGLGMKGEGFSGSKGGSYKGPEAPQNYGFTSVVAKAREAGGLIKQCAEGFMSFMGGSRSFPVMGMMDDRRHRLKNLIKDAAEGSVAQFGLKEWGQQFLMTDNGVFLTGNAGQTQGKGGSGGGKAGARAADGGGGGGAGGGQGENFKIRLALVENKNGKQQQQSTSSEAKQLARSFVSESGVEFEIETFELDADESRVYDREIAKGRTVAQAEAAVHRFAAARAGNGGSGGSGGGNSDGTSGNSKPTGQKTLHKEKSETYYHMDKDMIFTKRGNGYANVKDDISQTYHKDPKHDTRCDENHVHIGFGEGNKVWVDDSGCWSSKPIKIRNCQDQGGSSSGPPPTSGPPAYSASDPLSLDNNGNMSLAAQAPLGVASTSMMLARSIEYPVPDIGPKTVNPLILNFKAPLYMDTDGFLTSTGGGAGGVPEAPTTGLMYGRQSVAGTPGWHRALAITGDTLDGGNF